jgi:hypothetical protein
MNIQKIIFKLQHLLMIAVNQKDYTAFSQHAADYQFFLKLQKTKEKIS